ncbi:hypothetical protein VTK56DRAFT_5955 [Thermocarpiscus australiensis]
MSETAINSPSLKKHQVLGVRGAALPEIPRGPRVGSENSSSSNPAAQPTGKRKSVSHPESPSSRSTDSKPQQTEAQRQAYGESQPQSPPAPAHPQGGPQGQRKPLPGSSRHSATPHFGDKLPPITSLLPPLPPYSVPPGPTRQRPSHSSSSLAGPLAPAPGVVRPASCPPADHRRLPLIPAPQALYGQPPSAVPDGGAAAVVSTLPKPPAPLPSTAGPYRDYTMTRDSVARESLHQSRPFRCDVCSQSFSRNHDLKRHQRIHVAAKPFPCPRCGKFFSRKDALKRHGLVKSCAGTNLVSSSSPPPCLDAAAKN